MPGPGRCTTVRRRTAPGSPRWRNRHPTRPSATPCRTRSVRRWCRRFLRSGDPLRISLSPSALWLANTRVGAAQDGPQAGPGAPAGRSGWTCGEQSGGAGSAARGLNGFPGHTQRDPVRGSRGRAIFICSLCHRAGVLQPTPSRVTEPGIVRLLRLSNVLPERQHPAAVESPVRTHVNAYK